MIRLPDEIDQLVLDRLGQQPHAWMPRTHIDALLPEFQSSELGAVLARLYRKGLLLTESTGLPQTRRWALRIPGMQPAPLVVSAPVQPGSTKPTLLGVLRAAGHPQTAACIASALGRPWGQIAGLVAQSVQRGTVVRSVGTAGIYLYAAAVAPAPRPAIVERVPAAAPPLSQAVVAVDPRLRDILLVAAVRTDEALQEYAERLGDPVLCKFIASARATWRACALYGVLQ